MTNTKQNAPLNSSKDNAIDFALCNNIVDLIRQHAYDMPAKEALIFVYGKNNERLDERLSYAELDLGARRVASWLMKNFSIGSNILLLYPVGIDFVVAFLGCLYAGMVAVPAPLPGKLMHHQLRISAIINDAQIAAIFTDSVHASMVIEWIEHKGHSEIPLLATDTYNYEQPDAWTKPIISRNTLALLQYTSGSTSSPKGVMITHHNLLHNIDSFRDVLGFNQHTRFGGWIPLYHDMGLIAQLLPALFLGSTYVMMSPTDFLKHPLLWLQIIDKYCINHSAAPNFAYDLCCKRILDEQVKDLQLSHLKYLINGSEPVVASTMRKFAEKFSQAGFRAEALSPCYGMAEATVFISGYSNREPVICNVSLKALDNNKFLLANANEPSKDLVSCGIAPDYDVQIVDSISHKILPEDHVGEIWLKGDSLSQGYWDGEKTNQKTFLSRALNGNDGYFPTGDLGVLHHGEIYITGRIKEMLILNGRNIYPHDIEFAISSQILEFNGRIGAVFSVSTSEDAEVIIVTFEVNSDISSDRLSELTKLIKAKIQNDFGIYVSGVLLLKNGSVLRTTSGKIQRNAMKNLFLTKQLSGIYKNIDPNVEIAYEVNVNKNEMLV